jgi:hypothetical protein
MTVRVLLKMLAGMPEDAHVSLAKDYSDQEYERVDLAAVHYDDLENMVELREEFAQ